MKLDDLDTNPEYLHMVRVQKARSHEFYAYLLALEKRYGTSELSRCNLAPGNWVSVVGWPFAALAKPYVVGIWLQHLGASQRETEMCMNKYDRMYAAKRAIAFERAVAKRPQLLRDHPAAKNIDETVRWNNDIPYLDPERELKFQQRKFLALLRELQLRLRRAAKHEGVPAYDIDLVNDQVIRKGIINPSMEVGDMYRVNTMIKMQVPVRARDALLKIVSEFQPRIKAAGQRVARCRMK